MGKMKELFMEQNYPFGVDLEREYLIDDIIAQEENYLKYKALKDQEEEFNTLKTKIEVSDGTKIKINTKKSKTDREFTFN